MIDVLLATFRPNPAFLADQLASIRGQSGVDVNVISREDEERLGAARNFSALLEQSRADYVAFADQDDVWLPDKLSECLARIRQMETQYGRDVPLLVFCDGQVTDASLNVLSDTVISCQGVSVETGLAFSRLLMQNFVPGNAMLFNAALRQKAGRVPQGAIMHDAWIALVAAAFGHVEFVRKSLYRYRQHSANALGITSYGWPHLSRRLSQGVAAFRTRLSENIRQAQAFVDRFGADAPQAACALARFPKANWMEKRRLICRHALLKQGFARNLALFACA